MNRLLMGVLLLVGCTHVPAVELAPECYRYYEFFNAEGLTYEEVGKIADKMREKNCWPAMQGLLDTEPISAGSYATGYCELQYIGSAYCADDGESSDSGFTRIDEVGRR